MLAEFVNQGLGKNDVKLIELMMKPERDKKLPEPWKCREFLCEVCIKCLSCIYSSNHIHDHSSHEYPKPLLNRLLQTSTLVWMLISGTTMQETATILE